MNSTCIIYLKDLGVEKRIYLCLKYPGSSQTLHSTPGFSKKILFCNQQGLFLFPTVNPFERGMKDEKVIVEVV